MVQKTVPLRFTESEAEYLMENKLGRIATTSEEGYPHVVPVFYEFDGSHIYFSTYLKNSLKIRNIRKNNKVSFVVDDLGSSHPWRPRGIEIRGIAEALEKGGHVYVRITPLRKASWGL